MPDNRPIADDAEHDTCPVKMSDYRACERPSCTDTSDSDPRNALFCLMHSHNSAKNIHLFWNEINAIMERTSPYSRRKDRYDFMHFIFPNDAYFNGLILPKIELLGAKFLGNVSFIETTFTEDVDISRIRVAGNAFFIGAIIEKSFRFSEATFNRLLDLHGVRIKEPKLIKFDRVNRYSAQGLRIRLLNLDHLEDIRFEDIHWNSKGRRLTLENEMEAPGLKNFEQVASAYRSLVNNFESVRNYDLAEDCFIGAMEMKRLDPNNFSFGRQEWGKRLYSKSKTVQKWGEWLSFTNAYRLLSNYGSSYTRALIVWLGLLGFFGILYSIPGFGLSPTSDMAFLEGPYLEDGYSWQRLLDGFLYAFEVITFTREPTFTVTNYWGKTVRILETIFVPAQLALFFLALRRRFRR